MHASMPCLALAQPSPPLSLDLPSRVELKPTLQELFDAVHGACKAAVAALGPLPRLLPEVLAGCAATGPLPACLRCARAVWL